MGEILRATGTAEVAEAVEERIKSEGELQLVSTRPLGIFVFEHQRLGIDGSDLQEAIRLVVLLGECPLAGRPLASHEERTTTGQSVA